MPFAGSRMLRDLLALADIGFGRKHVATLMKRMGNFCLGQTRSNKTEQP